MPLLTFSNGRKQYVLHRISSGDVVKRNAPYPASVDDAPLEGFDPDLEYLAMDQDIQPDYDGRIFSLQTNEAKVGPLWRITFDTVKHDETQIKFAVTNAEAAQIQKQLADQNQTKLIMLALGVLFTALDKLSLTEEQQAVKDRVAKVTSAIWQNDAKVAELFAAVEAGQTPDLDTVWAAKL